MNILIGILTAIHVIVAVFLIVLVLMQKSSRTRRRRGVWRRHDRDGVRRRHDDGTGADDDLVRVHLVGDDVDSGGAALASRADGPVADGKGHRDQPSAPMTAPAGIPAFALPVFARDAARAAGRRASSATRYQRRTTRQRSQPQRRQPHTASRSRRNSCCRRWRAAISSRLGRAQIGLNVQGLSVACTSCLSEPFLFCCWRVFWPPAPA